MKKLLMIILVAVLAAACSPVAPAAPAAAPVPVAVTIGDLLAQPGKYIGMKVSVEGTVLPDPEVFMFTAVNSGSGLITRVARVIWEFKGPDGNGTIAVVQENRVNGPGSLRVPLPAPLSLIPSTTLTGVWKLDGMDYFLLVE